MDWVLQILVQKMRLVVFQENFIKKLRSTTKKKNNGHSNRRLLSHVFDQWMKEYDIPVYLNQHLAEVVKENGEIMKL